MKKNELEIAAEKIYHEWDDALSNNDIERLLSLYTVDAMIESPLIPHLLGTKSGICRGHQEFSKLLEIVVKRKPVTRTYHRTKFFTDGKTIMWEYPRETPQGEQMDFVEVMELKNGLISHHCVYWGWYGVNTLLEDKYRKDTEI